MRHGAAPDEDLAQLWRRIAFSIAIGNTDDHLRNHGFLLVREGWRLAPAYDVNPEPGGTGLSLNIAETDNSLRFDLALEVAPYFRTAGNRAKRIVADIKRTVSKWREIASGYGVSKAEQEDMAPAFLPSG